MKECETVRDAIQLYLPQARRDLGDHSYQTRVSHLAKFEAALGDKPLAECRAFDLQNFLNDHAAEWRAGCTIQGVIVSVKRVFNWLVEMEVIDRNPFARVKKPKGRRRRPVTDEEYRTLLRGADPQLRRFVTFLAFSGCRPIEAASMKWGDIDFVARRVVLQSHKTAKKTGKPRRIVLVPTLTKLLLWLRRRRQTSVIELVEAILRQGPVKAWELAGRMRPYGVTYHAVQNARKRMGVIRKRVTPGSADWPDLSPRQQTDLQIIQLWKEGRYRSCKDFADDQGYTLKEVQQAVERRRKRRDSFLAYALPPDYKSPLDPSAAEFVFLNSKGNPWHKSSMACAMKRIRRRTGLVTDAKFYGLRHRFGTRGVKHNVNLKILSIAMGHQRVSTTELYVSEDALGESIDQGVLQIIHGPGAIGVSLPAPVGKVIIVPEPPPVQEIRPETEHLPGRFGLGRDRPQVPVNGVRSNGSTEPASKTEHLLQAILAKLSEQPETARNGRQRKDGGRSKQRRKRKALPG